MKTKSAILVLVLAIMIIAIGVYVINGQHQEEEEQPNPIIAEFNISNMYVHIDRFTGVQNGFTVSYTAKWTSDTGGVLKVRSPSICIEYNGEVIKYMGESPDRMITIESGLKMIQADVLYTYGSSGDPFESRGIDPVDCTFTLTYHPELQSKYTPKCDPYTLPR